MRIYAPRDTRCITDQASAATRGGPELVTLADGALVALRPVQAGDFARLERMYYRLSIQSIAFRLFVGAPHVAHWAARFAAISATTTRASVAIVAVVGADVVGSARFDCDDQEASAEVGIIVEDAWQGRGIGRHLLRRLTREALARQLTTFTARTLAENRRAVRLFKGTFPGTRALFEQGEYTFIAPLLATAPTAPVQPFSAR